MKNLIIALVLLAGLASCQPEGRVFSENKELSPELQWLKNDVREFKVPIDGVNSIYDFSLAFRYTTGYRFNVLKVKVKETSPSGIELIKDYELKIRDENGDYIGESALDIWDYEQVIESGKKYEEKGTYTYSIEQNMPVDELNYAMEIGVIFDKEK